MLKLEAVNMMLLTVGQSPITALPSDLPEAALAILYLDQVGKEVQAKGWNFNTDCEVELTRAIDGTITVPADVYKADQQEGKDIIQRNGKMYNRTDKTYVFPEGSKFNVVYVFTFDNLPQFAQLYIYHKASRIFQQKVLGSKAIDGFTVDEEYEALAEFENSDSNDARYNLVSGNPWLSQLYKNRSYVL